MNESSLVCTPQEGAAAVPITFVMTQDDANGELKGTFSANAGTDLGSGSFDLLGMYSAAQQPGISEWLAYRFSGQMLEMGLPTAQAGVGAQLFGTLDFSRGFSGVVWVPSDAAWYTLTMSH
jgi:hypothetical protein